MTKQEDKPQAERKADNTAKQEAKRQEQEEHVAAKQAQNDEPEYPVPDQPIVKPAPVAAREQKDAEEEQSREQRLHDMGGAPINKG